MSLARIPAKKDLDSAYAVVANYIAQEYGPQSVNPSHIHSITHAALRHLRAERDTSITKWKKGSVPDSQQKEKLLKAVEKILVNAKTPWVPRLNLESNLQKLFLDVMRGDLPPAKKLLKERGLLHAVIWKKNPQILKEGRDLLNKIFIDMFNEIEQKKLSEKEALHLEIIIGDLLSLYPFLSPENGEEIHVPIRIEGKWHLANYQVQEIHMTPSWMGSPLVAYGLISKEYLAPPLLLFKGTTYPTDMGFGLSLITDMNPGASVGSYAFRSGRKKILSWINEYSPNQKVIVYGKSLGGAQAWRTALYYPDKVEKVMAYGAPGLNPRDIKRWNKILEKGNEPEINIFCQEGDSVPYYERSAQGFNYFLVLGEKPRNGILAHAEMFSTHERSVVLRMDSDKVAKKWKRIGLSCFRSVLSVLIFPLLILGHAAQTAVKKLHRKIVRKNKL